MTSLLPSLTGSCPATSMRRSLLTCRDIRRRFRHAFVPHRGDEEDAPMNAPETHYAKTVDGVAYRVSGLRGGSAGLGLLVR